MDVQAIIQHCTPGSYTLV